MTDESPIDGEPTDERPTDGTMTDENTTDNHAADETGIDREPTHENPTDERTTTDENGTDETATPGETPDAEAIARMVRTIRPGWEVRSARPAEDGYHLVYHLDVDTGSGTRECVLKATPEGRPPQAGVEARLLGVLRAHTAIPVPTVHGAVDDHGSLPAPYFLMASVPGETIRRTELDAIPAETVEWIARSSGRHLGELHSLDVVDAYGVVAAAPDHELQGDPPSGDPGAIAVADPVQSWPAYVRQSAEPALEALGSTRFGDLADEIEAAIDRRVEDLSGPFDPALAHVDDQIANHVVDRERRTVTGVLDWGFTLAATPGYDLAFAIHSLAGGPWSWIPSTPDLEPTVREALLEGYRRTGPGGSVDEYREHRELYELLTVLHSAVHFADRLELDGVDGEAIAAAAKRHREALRRHC